jgi:cyclic 2,3-diphosphoglycerate synthetase
VKPDVPVIATSMQPRPLTPVAGKRVAYFTTAQAGSHERLARWLGDVHGAEVVYVSGNLSDRSALAKELDSVDADVYLTEIKAAGIDLVAETGLARGVEVVLAANELMPLPGQPELEPELRALAEDAAAETVGT